MRGDDGTIILVDFGARARRYAVLAATVALASSGCGPSAAALDAEPDELGDAATQQSSVTTGRSGLAIGADVSEIPFAQSKGVVYSDTTGVPGDGMQILRNHGYRWARIRVNIDPASTDYGLFTDLSYATKAAVAAKARGFRILIDFHYSHWWADPGNQWKPTSWSGITTIRGLKSKVYSWTRVAMTTLAQAGVKPDMVQIGNEVSNGLLWPLGGPYQPGGSWANMAALMNQGIRGVKAVSSTTQIMIHLDSGGSWATTNNWISHFIANGGAWDSVDAVGFSYYPMWQGTFSDLDGVLKGMQSSHPSKRVWIVETAYYWKSNEAGYAAALLPYPQTADGQYAFLRALVDAVDDSPNVAGLFSWGAGWSQPSKWLVAPGWNGDPRCRALFDDNGRATRGIDGL